MSASAPQYAASYRAARSAGEVWTMRDAEGFPVPEMDSGARAMPVWSTRSSVERATGYDVAPKAVMQTLAGLDNVEPREQREVTLS